MTCFTCCFQVLAECEKRITHAAAHERSIPSYPRSHMTRSRAVERDFAHVSKDPVSKSAQKAWDPWQEPSTYSRTRQHPRTAVSASAVLQTASQDVCRSHARLAKAVPAIATTTITKYTTRRCFMLDLMWMWRDSSSPLSLASLALCRVPGSACLAPPASGRRHRSSCCFSSSH